MRVSVHLVSALVAAIVSIAAARQSAPAPPPSDGSGPKLQHAIGYYDDRLQRVVMVGGPGQARTGEADRVWSWSGRRWEPVTDDGPPGRTNAAAAYSRERGNAVVFGGARQIADNKWEVIGDSWVGGVAGWRPIGDLPPRDHHAMVSSASGGVLMFGGIPARRSDAWPDDTWELRREGWTRVAAQGPGARGRTALAFDATRRQVVLFGGVSAPRSDNSQTFFGDTWIWDGSSWKKAADDGPRGRYAHAMAFDERAGVVVMFSGAAAHSKAPLADMWQWSGTRWSEIALSGPTPGHRYQPVMVYDRARGRTVLFGGREGATDTWEWDGRNWRGILP